MSELADEHDLGSCAARRAGSSPAFPIQEGVAKATIVRAAFTLTASVARATLFELWPTPTEHLEIKIVNAPGSPIRPLAPVVGDHLVPQDEIRQRIDCDADDTYRRR